MSTNPAASPTPAVPNQLVPPVAPVGPVPPVPPNPPGLPVPPNRVPAGETPPTEYAAWNVTGWLPLVVGIAAIAAAALLRGGGPALHAVLVIAAAFLLLGLTPVAPGRARVIALAGRYAGTVRDHRPALGHPADHPPPGLHPDPQPRDRDAKVNDADGNPIEIAAVVVWQVADTAQAVYAVDDFVQFVAIQAETAVRHIATSYPYDARGEGQLSLREHADEITSQMSRRDRRPGRAGRYRGRRVAASRGCPTPRRSRRSCCAASRPRRSSRARQRMVEGAVGHGALGAGAARRGGHRRARRGAQGRHGQQPAGRAVQRTVHAAGGQHRHALPIGRLADDRKQILLRLDPAVHDALARWAGDELRSTTAQIEYLLRQALSQAGRLPSDVGKMPRRGRPPKAAPARPEPTPDPEEGS